MTRFPSFEQAANKLSLQGIVEADPVTKNLYGTITLILKE